ncbi:matrixin family metalloprotease [Haladaptatus sp. ZSTT2]|uniref:matrixin family metalloprotease n=1 Tax=Haladaptatus sp. ZSTT2 TaxID=3120515 RepID=UPI00300E75F3
MNGRVLLLSFLIVLAGCAAPIDPGFADTATPTTQSTGQTTAAPATQTQTPTPQATPTAVVAQDNPWQEQTLTVALSIPEGDSRDYEPLVEAALAYWEVNSERYAGYPLSFDFEPNAENPDIIIEFVPHVETCGDKREVAGCAPYITDARQVRRPETIQVLSGLSDKSTTHVLKHEFGHAMGLDHSDEPRSIMDGQASLTTLPQTNATERPLPWDHAELSVYVDYGVVPEGERAEARAQVQHALDYYAGGADNYVPENVSFATVDSASEADIVIRFTDRSPCGVDPGSCGAVRGQDPDGDGALETYTHLEITLTHIDRDATGWHVGWWLGYGFGFEEESEYPDPFREASYSDRRGEWWN